MNDSKRHCDVLLVGFEGQENLGLRSLAAYLKRAGICARITPLQGVTQEDVLREVQSTNPAIVGFSLIFQRMLDDYAQMITFLRDHGVTAHITVGGHYPTFEYRSMLVSIPALDSVVRHEGEETLLELANRLDCPAEWDQIQGLAFRRDGEIVVTPDRPLIPDLDSLSFPVRDPDGATHRGIGLRSIAGSRGCYYNCTFCSIHEFYRRGGPTRRTRSPAHLADEMEQLFHDLGVRIFILQDDDMFMRSRKHREWLLALLAEFDARALSDEILWRVSCRVDDVDANLLTMMKSAGLSSVYLGIESGSDEGLATFNKRYGVSDVYSTLEILKQVDMPFEFGFMLFEPYSTFATVHENIRFLSRVSDYGDSLVHFCKMSPYAGTPIAERLEREGRLTGTTASPDYRFLDARLDLLQTFYSLTFNHRNFDDRGLVERLRFAKFDAEVVAKFFADDYDADSYHGQITELIRRSNESAIETMSLAAHFIETQGLDKAMDHWDVLAELREQETLVEQRIGAELDRLMIDNGFSASVGANQTDTRSWPPVEQAVGAR